MKFGAWKPLVVAEAISSVSREVVVVMKVAPE